MIGDLDGEFASADEVKFRIGAFATERPDPKADIVLVLPSEPLLLGKLLHGWHVISSFDPLNQWQGYPHAIADRLKFEAARVKRVRDGNQDRDSALETCNANFDPALALSVRPDDSFRVRVRHLR